MHDLTRARAVDPVASLPAPSAGKPAGIKPPIATLDRTNCLRVKNIVKVPRERIARFICTVTF
jgi:hypothetical protein